jgi:hypothetical protein
LSNLINDLYKGGTGPKIGSGSAMDAYRYTRATGQLVGSSNHWTKLIEYRTALLKLWEKRAHLTTTDKKIVLDLLKDIQNALSGN